MQGDPQAQLGTAQFPVVSRNREQLPQFLHVKAGAVINNGNLHRPVYPGDFHLDMVSVFHGVAEEVFQDDLHGHQFEVKDQGVPRVCEGLAINLHQNFFISESGFQKIPNGVDQHRGEIMGPGRRETAGQGFQKSQFSSQSFAESLRGVRQNAQRRQEL